jgi:hypothetical protein
MSTLPVSPAPAAASVGRVNFFRSTVFQIIVVGLISFVGPGLWVRLWLPSLRGVRRVN